MLLVMCACTLAVLLAVVIGVFVYTRYHKTVTPVLKAVLITGCDHGFGYMLAKRLDRGGYKIFAGCLDIHSEGASNLRSVASSKLSIIPLDVTNDAQIEAARSTITEMLLGHVLWAVVNNAGVGDYALFEWYPKVQFKKLMDVNFMGMVNVTRTFLPLIRAAKGRIINMSSMAGRTAMPGYTAYSASKFAVIGFSESLRREMSVFGVTVVTVEPSLYKTGLSDVDIVSTRNADFWAAAEPGIKRDYGESYFRDTQAVWGRILRFGSGNHKQVIDCYVHAVTAVHPHSRYAPPFIMRISNDFMNLLAPRLQDFIIKTVLGVTAKPDMVSPDHGDKFRTGRRRSHAY
ncbi:unnamed protein product [Candidula unifasciata]|uniref:Uncharacterized protein n=1 Tax=Candidula unifasciata TaxID=100452 RepID=A0A8S3ZTV2_9EUPU|nr:unnamed protein product [Candidula unifasciata]